MQEKLLRAKDLADTNPEYALKLCNEVLDEDFDNDMALFIQGYILMQTEKFGLAYNLFQRCAQLRPNQTEIYNNMGMCLEIDYPERAMECFDKALAIHPKNHHAMINKALMHLKRAEPEKCVKLCTEALRIDPSSRAAHDNKAQGLLMLREWAHGWDEYTHSWGGKHRRKRDFDGLPEWEGQENATVIVYGEQGLGDEILFASCVPDLREMSKQVILECDRRLQNVFERSFGVEAFGTRYDERSPITDWHKADYVISAGELPRFFRRTHRSFPGDAYLKPDHERCVQWQALLKTMPGLKIGLAWTGGLKNTGKAERSIDLDTLAPLFDLPHTFVSLEYKEPDLLGYPIKHWSRAVDKSVDFDDTLALINELDLVISVTTTVVHAAGALGKECWCLVPKHPSFRFHLSGDMPWHKSVKLIRQTDTWEDVVFQVKRKLEALC